jgi:heterotetrameric sarcosine oxidase gamma subunit
VFDGDVTLVRREAFSSADTRSSAGLSIEVRREFGLVSISRRAGRSEDFTGAVRELFEIDLPEGPQCSIASHLVLMGIGPRSWLAVRDGARPGWSQSIADGLGSMAAVTDQTGAFGIVRLSGSRVRDCLASAVFLDFHPDVFPVGAVAVTRFSHFTAIIWRLHGESVFDLAVPRSVAQDFWQQLAEHAVI